MHIGILTYHRAHNYGAMLQAYALRQFLCTAGHEVEFIDYWSEEHTHAYSLWRFPHYYRGVKTFVADWIVWCMTLIKRNKRRKAFILFAKEYLGIGNEVKYSSNQQEIKENYDVVVFGSDQIWRNYASNMDYLSFDPAYFGTIVPQATKKVAYAASMGVIKTSDEERRFLQKQLTKFSSIYVRENNLHELIGTLGLKSEVVCDPTLLLTKEQWNKLLPQKKFLSTQYLLYYEVMESPAARNFAVKMAKHKGLTLRVLTARDHPFEGKEVVQQVSPVDFLHAIRDAEFVIATSFHGTAFSVIFEKQFVAMNMGKNSNRVESLLASLGVENHYQSETDMSYDVCAIDYQKVGILKDRYVERSVSLLLETLKTN